jgi:hypothetical protein
VRAHRGEQRLGGLAQDGYCAALRRWFHGVREHLVFTPGGRITFVLQVPGNRHDVQGLYGLLQTTFRGHLLGDNAYWPSEAKRETLAGRGLTVTAADRSNYKVPNSAEEKALLKRWRGGIERLIALFDQQFHADRTRCRSPRHYEARRWMKVLSHNLSRHLNDQFHQPHESLAHYRVAA